MRTGNIVAGAIALLLSSSASLAYEQDTHVMLTTYAASVDASVIKGTGSVLADMQLPAFDTGLDYTSSSSGQGSALQMLRIGVFDEDNLPRPLNHFYDMQYSNFAGRGLDTTYLSFHLVGLPSPQWALEDTGDVVDLTNGAAQIFSYRQAEQYFYQGLTQGTYVDRMTNLSRMFESLGHVLHHIQDMGQPQHARNDRHNTADRGFYERYTLRRFSDQTLLNNYLNTHVYGAPPPDFSTARQYWYTNTTPAAQPAYRGMAEYSSENFVTFGTQFLTAGAIGSESIFANSSNLPYPNGTGKSWLRNQSVTLQTLSGGTVTGNVDFIVGNVTDGYAASQNKTGLRLSSTSLLDKHLVPSSWWPSHSRKLQENSLVFDDMHTALLPRAVSFSTGMLNHFFRGRMNFTRPNADSNAWTITNTSTSPNGALNGMFRLYSEDASKNRAPITSAVWSLNIPVGGNATVQVPEPPSGTKKLALVFNGQIGSEPANFNDAQWYAVSGRVVDYSPPPVICSTPRSDSGGWQGIDYTMNLGTRAGRVQVQYEAYSIPDKLVITSQNANHTSFVDTGTLISGFHTYQFDYDPVTLGSNQIHVVVTGNPEPTHSTAWNTVVGCPGQTLNTGNGALPQRAVTFTYGARLMGALGGCTASIYIDGVFRGTAAAGATGPSPITLTIGPGHGMSFSNYQCEPDTRNVLVGISYADANGTHTLGNMSSTNTLLFDVH